MAFGEFQLSITVRGFHPEKIMHSNLLLQAGLRKVMRKLGDDTRRLAKSLCPVDTTYMRNMIKTTFSEEGLRYDTGWDLQGDFIAKGKQPYPFYQEFGTIHHPAQPCLNPAYQRMFPEAIAATKGYVAQWAAVEIHP